VFAPAALTCAHQNHNPAAQNGAQSAWNVLSPVWDGFSHTYIRSTIEDNMSWVNYRAGGMGEIVDRFRWEAGCIVEHVGFPLFSPARALGLDEAFSNRSDYGS
jgi:hypothetical protein